MDIIKIAETIKNGGVIIFPTDTVYGLMCNPNNSKAIDKIFSIKKRIPSKTLPLLVGGLAKAKVISKFNGLAEALARKYWPGAYTFVVEAKQSFDERLLRGNSIALRCPNYAELIELINLSGGAVAATSANISGEPNYSLQEIERNFQGKVDYVHKIPKSDMKMQGSVILDVTNPIGIKVLRNYSQIN